jgi:hypothetical protein
MNKKIPQRELAELTGLSLGTINNDIRAGAPSTSREEFLAWRGVHRQKSCRRQGKRAVANPGANAEASGPVDPGVDMIPVEKAISIFREFTLPLKRELERLPVLARARANPSDPALAEAVLKAEVRSILARVSTFEGSLDK